MLFWYIPYPEGIWFYLWEFDWPQSPLVSLCPWLKSIGLTNVGHEIGPVVSRSSEELILRAAAVTYTPEFLEP